MSRNLEKYVPPRVPGWLTDRVNDDPDVPAPLSRDVDGVLVAAGPPDLLVLGGGTGLLDPLETDDNALDGVGATVATLAPPSGPPDGRDGVVDGTDEMVV